MATLYKTIQYRGFDINVYYDDLCESPRDFAEHMTTIWCNSRSYTADNKSIDDLLHELDLYQFPNSFKNLCAIANKKGYLAVPIYAYIHSGIALSLSKFSDRWDSGTFGVITIPKSVLYQEYNCKRINKKLKDKLIGYINAEVKEYEAYCNGQCFRYEIAGDDNDECCGGFYGDDFENNGLMEDAKDTINCIIESRKRESVDFWNNIDKDIAA